MKRKDALEKSVEVSLWILNQVAAFKRMNILQLMQRLERTGHFSLHQFKAACKRKQNDRNRSLYPQVSEVLIFGDAASKCDDVEVKDLKLVFLDNNLLSLYFNGAAQVRPGYVNPADCLQELITAWFGHINFPDQIRELEVPVNLYFLPVDVFAGEPDLQQIAMYLQSGQLAEEIVSTMMRLDFLSCRFERIYARYFEKVLQRCA